jgi:hypothetical protein
MQLMQPVLPKGGLLHWDARVRVSGLDENVERISAVDGESLVDFHPIVETREFEINDARLHGSRGGAVLPADRSVELGQQERRQC